jgi:L-threonylcarbamoyladenylate synthase
VDEVTRVLPLEPFEASLGEALDVLRAGGLIAFRTDTLYGITASPRSERGMTRLRALKSRDASGAFVSLADSAASAFALSGVAPGWTRELAESCWPGPVSMVLAVGDVLPPSLWSPEGSWAVRVPAHPWCRALARGLGAPLPSSSANRPGQPPARSAAEAVAQLGESLDLVIDGGPVSADTPPSALVDCRAWPPRLLRGEFPALAKFVRRRAELDPN